MENKTKIIDIKNSLDKYLTTPHTKTNTSNSLSFRR